MRPYFWPLTAMVILQVAGSIMLFAVAVLAPAIAPDLGIEPAEVGFYSALVFLGASVGSLFSAVPIARLGPVRASQIGLLVSAGALLIPGLGSWTLALLAGLAVGLGYGPFTPASTQILTAVSEDHERPLVLSIKQAAAPLGTMLGGAILPSLALSLGWLEALAAVSIAAVVAAVAVQPMRGPTDRRDAGSEAPTRFALGLLVQNPALRRLTAAALLFSATQMCAFTFIVGDLVDRIGLEFRLAGLTFSIMGIGGFVARLVWGWLAERFVRARALLTLLGLAGGLSLLGFVLMSPSWPFLAVAAVAGLVGVTVAGWNGVFLSEVVQVIPRAQLASAVGTTMCFLYSGLVIGPAAFSSVVSLSGSYPLAYGGLALACATGGVLVWRTGGTETS